MKKKGRKDAEECVQMAVEIDNMEGKEDEAEERKLPY